MSVQSTPEPLDFATYGDYGAHRRKQIDDTAAAEDSFIRARYPFRGRISDDDSTEFPAERGRYHLYICWACPWAQRAAIVRSLKGLEGVVSMSVVDPLRDGRGWAFRDTLDSELDPVNGFAFLSEAYEATEPGFDGHASVPLLWDKARSRIVSNNFPDITIDLGTKFERWADRSVDTYPLGLRAQIDELNALIYDTVNDGVYRCGFSRAQSDYEHHVRRLFDTLDLLEERLSAQRYLFGDAINESDIRLYVTLARFDAVYYSHFKVNLRRLVDYPNLWAYARDVYSLPAFRNTTNFGAIKRHYFMTHSGINPTRIVPLGPAIDWDAPQDRASRRD